MSADKDIELIGGNDELEDEYSHNNPPHLFIRCLIIISITMILVSISIYTGYNWTISNINTSHSCFIKVKVEKNGTTLQNLAKRFIPDLNIKNGVKLIMKKNKFDNENRPLFKGDIILIPTNGNSGLLTTGPID